MHQSSVICSGGFYPLGNFLTNNGYLDQWRSRIFAL